jgi:hypothetical protein
MITISIQPYSRRKLAALGVAFLCASTVSCFADAMYLASAGPTNRDAARVERKSETRPDVQSALSQLELNRWTANFRQVGAGNHTIAAPAITETACRDSLRVG